MRPARATVLRNVLVSAHGQKILAILVCLMKRVCCLCVVCVCVLCVCCVCVVCVCCVCVLCVCCIYNLYILGIRIGLRLSSDNTPTTSTGARPSHPHHLNWGATLSPPPPLSPGRAPLTPTTLTGARPSHQNLTGSQRKPNGLRNIFSIYTRHMSKNL